MNPMVNVATSAARAAAKIILTGLDRIDSVRIAEKSRNDFVTSVDKAAEAEIIAVLSNAYPDHKFLSEEAYSDTELNDTDSFWIIDPLDGTTNFIHRIPHFAIAMAFYHKGKVELSLVYDPVRDELFTALRGKGARCNQQRMRVSSLRKLDRALIATGFPSRNAERQAPYIATINDCFERVGGVRRSGSAALDIAYVACGRYDGFFDTDLKVWDVAASNLLVQESGGYVKDFAGNSSDIICDNIIVSNPDLYPQIQALVADHYSV
ncbi:MAG: inositol monophosphatase [Legionellales bacterium]|jgi:myo-inositol-1(or 4)-monophosphatase|nr:inositol monophosphatase [Legionellales bacterium]